MHTPTNYYLFSLAVSDLLVLLLGMPLELYEKWRNYPFLLGAGGCYFRTLLFETVCLASVLNVTALSVERYVAVVHPLQARSVMTPAHVRRMIGAIWSLALLCSLPNTSLHGIQLLDVPCRGIVPDSAECKVVRSKAFYSLLMQATALLFFCLPMAIISVLYLLIGLRLRSERLLLLRQGPQSRVQRLQDRSRTQVTKMLLSIVPKWTPRVGLSRTVCITLGLSVQSLESPSSMLHVVLVLVFGICWAPFHIERLMWSFMSSTEYLLEAYQYVHIISGVFFYLSSAANPVLYSLMSTRFQDTFREALCLGTRCRGHRRRHSSHSLSRVTTGSTLCDMGSLGSRAHPLAENYGLEGQEETDPSLHRGDSQQLHLEAPEGHL
ncbi:Neuromedin-U receptor 1 [Myotis davidii]|uniref:Neuromedin-U receptor 1 n=1 Tax=Myotis davidii TaxID=225400 RepID=L5M4G1_MYODS|nr:Neuromedin-U receptor 1 [Myotis davidii]